MIIYALIAVALAAAFGFGFLVGNRSAQGEAVAALKAAQAAAAAVAKKL